MTRGTAAFRFLTKGRRFGVLSLVRSKRAGEAFLLLLQPPRRQTPGTPGKQKEPTPAIKTLSSGF